MPRLDFFSPATLKKVLADLGKNFSAIGNGGEGPPGLYGKLSLFGYLGFCLNVLLLLYIYYSANVPETLHGENGWIEQLTALLFGVTALALFLTAAGTRRGWRRWVYALGGLAAVFLCGEEINWGQNYFGFDTPGFLREINLQGEANVHNIQGVNFLNVVGLWLPNLPALLVIIAFLNRKYTLFGLPLPTLWLAVFLILAPYFGEYNSRGLPLYRILRFWDGTALILAFLAGFAGFARDKKLLLTLAPIIALSAVMIYLPARFALYSRYDVLQEIHEYLLGLTACLYSFQLLRDSGAGGRWASRMQPARVSLSRLLRRRPADHSATAVNDGSLPPPLGWFDRSYPWAWPAAALLIILASIGLTVLDWQASAAVGRRYDALRAAPPDFQSHPWSLYLNQQRLTYLNEVSCPLHRDGKEFLLHITPVHQQDLPPVSREDGFQNIDILFGDHVERFVSPSGGCMGTVKLPDYPIAQIRTGELAGKAVRWQVRLDPNGPKPREFWRSLNEGAAGEPAARAVFDLYRRGNALYYYRESCAEEDTTAGFFLHLIPSDLSDLPPARRQYGFDNLDFAFKQRGARFEGACLASVQLPDYPITGIRTGQFTADRTLWQVELH